MKNNNLYDILSIAVLAIGIMLLLFMITYEGEPGAIPLILIILGTSGFFARRFFQHTRKSD